MTVNVRVNSENSLLVENINSVWFFTSHEYGVVIFQSDLCVSACNALTFESLDLESSLLLCMESLGHMHIPRSSDEGQGHRSRKECLCVHFVGGLSSTKRQSCLSII